MTPLDCSGVVTGPLLHYWYGLLETQQFTKTKLVRPLALFTLCPIESFGLVAHLQVFM